MLAQLTITALHSQHSDEYLMARVWLITGASRGIGAALVAQLLDAGQNVVATSRDVSPIRARHGELTNLLAVPMDVADEVQIGTAVEAALVGFGRIDVLVNNAGYGHIGIFEETSLNELRDQFEVNVFGVFAVTKAVAAVMRQQRSGLIVNMSSYAAFQAGFARGAYNPSKFVIEGWSQALADEMSVIGVKVVCISPGFFRTDIWDESSMRYSAEAGTLPEYAERWEQFKTAHTALNHTQKGDPEKLASLIIEVSEMDEPPTALLAGSETVDKMLSLLESRAQNVRRWEHLTRSTDGDW